MTAINISPTHKEFQISLAILGEIRGKTNHVLVIIVDPPSENLIAQDMVTVRTKQNDGQKWSGVKK